MASRPDTSHDANERRVRRLLRALALDTGDVLLFDRKCSSMGVYGGAICVCAKLLGQTHWDHTGVIVRIPSEALPAEKSSKEISSEEKSSEEKSDEEDEQLFVLEAALTGVKLRPLVARVLRSGGHDVVVRKLQFARTVEVQARGQEFALSVVHAPYEDELARLFNAGVSVPTRLARERLFAAFIAAKQELARLDVELLHRDKMSVFEKEALRQEREAVQKRCGQLGAELRGKERSVFENAVEKQATKMFCSQLVAAFYQHLGLLLPYPSASSYLPKHFSAREGGEFLQLQQGASFLPEISLRKELETETKRYVTREHERKDRGPCAASETAAIVHCLRRHQLFHTLSEPELLAAAAQFRRRVLTKGEVVFHQGTLGDCFYIIERGHCDVFVDYDHPMKTNAVLHAAHTDSVSDPELQQRTELRRHKTIVLPEFKSSSSQVGKNERVHVATNGPGNAFGASALIYDTPRRATLQASYSEPEDDEGAVVLWQLDKQAFCEILARHPGTQRSLEECRFLLETLEDHPLFAELDDRAKALAVRKCFPLSVRAGTTILRQGDPGDYFYLVESGRCEVSRCKPKVTNPFVDRVIGRGASFGEAALLYNSRRGASVKALDDAKIWCMDRASFLTITRSGSAALHKLFSKVGTTVVSGSNESFATERDLRRMLTDPQQMQLIRHCDTKDDDDDDDEEFDEMAALSGSLPSAQSYNRAVQLALSVLLNDSSGLVNFSQFAHFHIALGASNIDQLLPEAAFRVLKSVADTYHEGDTRVPMPSTSPTLFDPVDPDQATIKLNDLSRAIRQWLSTGETAGDACGTPETTVCLTPGRLAFYERLFDLPAHQFGDQYVTHDDLVRGITAFEMEDARSGSKEDDDDAGLDDVVAAKVEFRAFLAALKSDISALRTIWRAAKLQARGGDNAGKLGDRRKLTFDANLKSGWIAALRLNPTGSDWEYLQPVMEDEYQSAAYNDTNAMTHGKQLTAQITSFAAAIAAGALARTMCAPLERLKMLMQLSIPKPMPAAAMAVAATAKPTVIFAPYTSLTRGVLNMVKLSGLRSLFSGNLAHCIWVVPLVPTKFALCRIYQDQVGRLLPGSSWTSGATEVGKPLVSAMAANLAMGGLAGLTLNCLFYPLDVIRGRLTVQQYYNANRPSRGIIDCARSIRDKAGLRGFYQGFAPASLGVATSIGCSFAFYESLRPIFVLYDTADTRNQLGRPSVPGQIMCATMASLASQCIAYPFDVIRRRVQLQGTKWHPELAFPTYKSAWHCVKTSVQEDGGGVRGLRSLYRGMFVNAVKALPPTVISFLSYEKLWGMEHSAEDA